MNQSILTAAVQTFLEHAGIDEGPLVVACSGGPDSLALLRALQKLHRPGISLVAAHLNHQLRGAQSDADQHFVIQYCHANQMECRTASRHIRDIARSTKENLESAARHVRYEWLAEVAKECGSRYVATGHTADDQAETLMHRLLRGAGLRGLRGIAPRRALTPAIDVIRPLLKVRRDEVLAFLESEQITARLDSSNQDLTLTRNRIRHELLPWIRQHWQPEITDILCRLAEQAGEVYREQEQAARMLLIESERPRAGSVIILDANRLAAAPRHILRELFYLIWDREHWPVSRMGHDHWERLADLVFSTGGAHDLPSGVHAQRKGNVLQLRRR